MRAIKKSYSQTTEHYEQISKFEKENLLKSDIESGLSSIFLISQNFPIQDVSDFFTGENFSLLESFEELEASYELIKYGFYKQSMISLRIGFEVGLLSIYWSIIGKKNREFKKWLSSKLDTPYKNEKFWKTLKSNQNIAKFDEKYSLIQEIKGLGFLSDFVHTKGIWHSNFGDSQRAIKGQDKFENFKIWIQNFKQIVKILEILHLLKFPTICLRFSTDFLISKFGTFSKIPQFGGGFGDEMEAVFSFIPVEQKQFIEELSKNDDKVKDIIDWLSNLPNLSENEINDAIIEEQKQNIEFGGGFANWEKNVDMLHDNRISKEMINLLREWAEQNNLMDLNSIMKKMKKNENKT